MKKVCNEGGADTIPAAAAPKPAPFDLLGSADFTRIPTAQRSYAHGTCRAIITKILFRIHHSQGAFDDRKDEAGFYSFWGCPLA